MIIVTPRAFRMEKLESKNPVDIDETLFFKFLFITLVDRWFS